MRKGGFSMNAKKLNSEINDFRFLLRGNRFIDNSSIKFSSAEEAKNFLIKFLVVEGLAGIHYSDRELMSTFRKIRKLIKRNKVISSEDLPIHQMKKHSDKVLQNVIYKLQGNVCSYEKDSS